MSSKLQLSDTRCARPLGRWWWVVVWVMLTGILMVIGRLIPPMQSPDEGAHLMRAYGLSRGVLLQPSPTDSLKSGSVREMNGDVIDHHLLAFFVGHTYEWLLEPKRLTPQRQAELAAIKWEARNREEFFPSPGTAYYAPIIYLPHAVGLGLGRWFDQTIETSVAWASGLVSALAAALVVTAVAVWRPPWVVWGLLTLPMMLFQAASPTIDGITTGALLLCLSWFANHWSTAQRMSMGVVWMFLACIVVCGTSRIHMLVLLCLPFALGRQVRQPSLLLGGVVCALLVLGWTVYATITTVDLRVTRSVSTVALLQHYLSSPDDLLALLGRTLRSPHMQVFYQQSFIGLLGWLDTPLAAYHYVGFAWGLLALTLLSCLKIPKGAWGGRALLVMLGLLSALSVFVALALTYNDVGAETIQGVQGRYFLAPALMVAFGLYWGRMPSSPSRSDSRLCWHRVLTTHLPLVAVGCFASASVVVLADVLGERYRPLIVNSKNHTAGASNQSNQSNQSSKNNDSNLHGHSGHNFTHNPLVGVDG